MSDTSHDIVIREDLKHIAHLLGQQTQQEFNLEIGRVESALRKEIKDTKRMLIDIHERLNKISLLANPETSVPYIDPIEPIWGEDGR